MEIYKHRDDEFYRIDAEELYQHVNRHVKHEYEIICLSNNFHICKTTVHKRAIWSCELATNLDMKNGSVCFALKLNYGATQEMTLHNNFRKEERLLVFEKTLISY